MVNGVMKYTERKCVGKIGWLQILEQFSVSLKEWMASRIL